jgi:hypothetical protein
VALGQVFHSVIISATAINYVQLAGDELGQIFFKELGEIGLQLSMIPSTTIASQSAAL